MDFERRRTRRPTEPVVPLINVVFLLLIFFLLTGTLRSPGPFDVEPPTTVGGHPEVGRSPTVALAPDGRIAIDDASVSPGDLVETLRARLEGESDRHVLLRADRATPARHVLPLLDELAAAGVESVQLVAREGG